MKDILEKIKSRGYWEAVIRPSVYRKDRISDISNLIPILEKNVVKLRGWNFPHFDSKFRPNIYKDYIGHGYEWEHHKAVWRFNQSGQFAHVWCISLDWRDDSRIWPADDQWQPGTLLGVGDTIFTFIEILDLASRLSLSKAGDNSMTVEITIHGLEGRSLFIDSNRSRWPFDYDRIASIDNYHFSNTYSRDDLVSNTKDIAISHSLDLFKRFRWNTTKDIINDWIDKRG